MRAWLVQQGFEPGDLRSEKLFAFQMKTPMAQACCKDELNVCKWLYRHGAAEDISRANNLGYTPMFFACKNGHLSVCEWLYKVGAEEDISRADNDGKTPMLMTRMAPTPETARAMLEMLDLFDASEDGTVPEIQVPDEIPQARPLIPAGAMRSRNRS